jgi:parallel beta-helix repeat protein
LLPRETDAATGEADYRGIIARNNVHDNFNEIFSWVGTKTFVHAKIDEGKGISLQRNQEFKNGGRILVANNIAFWNGYSGIHSQDGDNIDMFSNTAYMNSYTNTRGEYKDDGDARGGNNIGVSLQGGEDVRIANNVAYIDTSWRGMPVSIANEKGDTVVANNLVFGEGSAPLKLDADYERLAVGTIVADPMFELESGRICRVGRVIAELVPADDRLSRDRRRGRAVDTVRGFLREPPITGVAERRRCRGQLRGWRARRGKSADRPAGGFRSVLRGGRRRSCI